MIIGLHEFLKLRETLPIVDVRSEGEFHEGHIAQAINIPLLNNAERVEVGTHYKQKGQAEAIKTGFRLVGPRLNEIVTEAEKVGKEFLVHCWRGGMRSSNFCQFVGMAGIKTFQLQGGYKSYREQVLATFSNPYKLIVIGGYTGSGKSDVLRALRRKGEQVIDLEDLANHKGSVFGGLMMPAQPSTEQFQNNLFEIISTFDITKRVWIEDEAIAVGKIFLPEPLWRRMRVSPGIEMVVDQNVRIERLVREYGQANPSDFIRCMEGITKKLGGQNFNAAKEKLLEGDFAAAIGILLSYYDKAYLNNHSRRTNQVKFNVPWMGKNIDNFADELLERTNREKLWL